MISARNGKRAAILLLAIGAGCRAANVRVGEEVRMEPAAERPAFSSDSSSVRTSEGFSPEGVGERRLRALEEEKVRLLYRLLVQSRESNKQRDRISELEDEVTALEEKLKAAESQVRSAMARRASAGAELEEPTRRGFPATNAPRSSSSDRPAPRTSETSGLAAVVKAARAGLGLKSESPAADSVPMTEAGVADTAANSSDPDASADSRDEESPAQESSSKKSKVVADSKSKPPPKKKMKMMQPPVEEGIFDQIISMSEDLPGGPVTLIGGVLAVVTILLVMFVRRRRGGDDSVAPKKSGGGLSERIAGMLNKKKSKPSKPKSPRRARGATTKGEPELELETEVEEVNA